METVTHPESASSVPDISDLQYAALRALLYYDIWAYPLNLSELYVFLPVSCQDEDLEVALNRSRRSSSIGEYEGYYFAGNRSREVVERRRVRERHARRMWKVARLWTQLIKRFPFVRAVFISGELSKNVTGPESDIDFFILTEPGRLWICRTLLILFKKVFLFNKKKYFCLNYFSTTDHLLQAERDIYVATEVVYVKPLFNRSLFEEFMKANKWIGDFFPNFRLNSLPTPATDDRRSIIQKALETFLNLLSPDRLDTYLMNKMHDVWKERYPQYDTAVRETIFRCTKQESRAYGGDFRDRVLSLYDCKLKEFDLDSSSGDS